MSASNSDYITSPNLDLQLQNGPFQKSCGCYRDHVSKENGKANTRHGETGTPLHNLWHLMKQRCYDSNQRSYPNYGGRGIKVYRKWKNNYELFRDYALAQGYKPGLQIDRYPDNNGNYRPGNIRFVTCKVNQRNRRDNIVLTAFGESKTLVEWSEDDRCEVTYNTLWDRVRKMRIPLKLALSFTNKEVRAYRRSDGEQASKSQ